jgi:hypothetical protein
MQNIQPAISHSQKIGTANTTFVEHYAQWASHMLTLTFKDHSNGRLPDLAQIDRLLNHLKATLNWSIWKKRTKHNAKAKILFLPIVEGMNGNKRVHVHILLGNIKNVCQLHQFITSYIADSTILGVKYDITEVYSADGLSCYVTKETYKVNSDAVRWDAALIPAALIPKRFTLLKA